jgi:hypothetical protein
MPITVLCDGRSSVWVTVVAQWAKVPGIHCYVAGLIPAVIPRYCTKKIEKCSEEHKKNKGKKTVLCDSVTVSDFKPRKQGLNSRLRPYCEGGGCRFSHIT